MKQTKSANAAPTRDRTEDLAVNSRSLYQRSSGGNKRSCFRVDLPPSGRSVRRLSAQPTPTPGRRGTGPAAGIHFRQVQPCRDSLNAFIAQLGERQTEDLKVLGSIPSVGIMLFV